MFGNFRCINIDNGKRLVCCVDTLGKAKKLVVVNDSELELTTGRGPDDSQADARQSDDEGDVRRYRG